MKKVFLTCEAHRQKVKVRGFGRCTSAPLPPTYKVVSGERHVLQHLHMQLLPRQPGDVGVPAYGLLLSGTKSESTLEEKLQPVAKHIATHGSAPTLVSIENWPDLLSSQTQ